MPPPDRFDIIVPLHEVAGWRRALAVDRGGVAPRAVVLSYPPPALTDDPTRLVELMRDAEAAALVHHPNAVPILGLETSGDLLVAVEAYRRGVSLASLLRAAGRVPPALAARVAVDACAALAAVHAVDPGDGQPLVHGGVTPARLLVADDGSTLLCGTGTCGGGAPADDVRAVAAVLHECLSGRSPDASPGAIDAPGVPQPLLDVVSRALGAAPGGPCDGPEALADAISAATPPAPPEAMAAYLEAILPAGEGERGELLRLVAHGLSRAAAPRAADASDAGDAPFVAGDAARPPDPAAGSGLELTVAIPLAARTPSASPPVAREPAPEPARAAPALAPQPSSRPSVPATRPPADDAPQPPAASRPARPGRARVVLTVALVMAVIGFGGGFVASRWRAAPPAQAAPTVAAAPPPSAPATPAPGAPTAGASDPGAYAPAPSVPPPEHAPAPAAEVARAAARPAQPASIAVTAEPPGEVYVDGKRVGRAPVTVPVARGEHDVRLRSRYEGVDVRRRVTVRGPGTAVRFALRRGALKVTAPENAEVFVDGRRVGRGDVKVDLWEGTHVVEARLGEARVTERFTLGPGETWTYDVTPTP